MNIDSLLQQFQRFGVRLGLSQVRSLLDNLGNPQNQVPVIHVAGSNGKGSVCAYLSSILTEAGYRTGRYTSPHLVDWTERICLNNQPIPKAELYQALLQVQAAIPKVQRHGDTETRRRGERIQMGIETSLEPLNQSSESPTQFEVITAAAWLYFAQQQVDIAVIEVGLGGRLDATNVCQPPLVSIITSISREHWQKLGNTVAEIAGEKAGIIKQGCPVVMGVLPPDAEEVVRSQAGKLQSPLIVPQSSRQLEPGWAEYQGNSGKTLKYPLPLPGQVQLTNSAVALAAVEILQSQGWKITESAIINGMAKTQWAGRMQWTTWKNQKLLIDGAHNPDSARVLRNYIDSLNVPSITWVMGILGNKDHREIFQNLLRSHNQEDAETHNQEDAERDTFHRQLHNGGNPRNALAQDRITRFQTPDFSYGDSPCPLQTLYLVPVPDHNSANPTELAELATSICPELQGCYSYPELPSALDAAFTSANGDLVVLSGSLYLLGHFLSISSRER